MQRKSIPSIDYAKESHQVLDIDPNLNETQMENYLSKQKSHGSFRTALRNILYDYSENSTIHGVSYIGERQRPWTERIWWIVALGISIIFCCGFIWSSYKKWQESPVIVTFADKSTSIWQIPFPAVTICPDTKVKTKYLNFAQAYNIYTEDENHENHNLTDEELHMMKTVYQTCDFNFLDPNGLISDSEIFANESLAKTVEDLAPDNIFLFCRRKNSASCMHFVRILTEEGICYTYNMLNASEIYRESALHSEYVYPNHENVAKYWTLEDGYKSDAPMRTYPERALGDGIDGGLYAWMSLLKEDFDYLCRGAMQGFKVLLHSPDEIPQISKHYFRLDINQEVTVSVKPSMFTTSDGLKHYDANRRQCYFNKEPTLKFFKVYNQRNCELECLTLYTLEKCGCVKFSMPHEEGTPICGLAKVDCYREAQSELLEMEIMNDLSKDTKVSHCNCLPACTSIVYEAEISSTDLDWKNHLRARNIPLEKFSGDQSVTLSIFFKEKQFITSRRSELYGLTDFIANCGGLLGLFMGFSILSIVEIIYFCSIRLFCNLRRRSTLAPSPVNDQNDQQRESLRL